jgi:hypothetical protein
MIVFTQSDVLRIKEVAKGNFWKSLIALLSIVYESGTKGAGAEPAFGIFHNACLIEYAHLKIMYIPNPIFSL